ncbi:MAG: hypothetical protein J0G28_06720 [Afipia sp.]|nr:hypothetical protein [Afipia sp.]
MPKGILAKLIGLAVIASEAKKSSLDLNRAKALDCFGAYAPRNDDGASWLHARADLPVQRRGWPEQSPAMTTITIQPFSILR